MVELMDLLNQSDEEDTFIQLVEAQWVDDVLKLRILARPDFDTPSQEWTVECLEVASFKLNHSVAQSLSLLEDHVLLWPFKEDTADAFFYGKPDSPAAAVGQLYEAHLAIAKGWIPFEHYFNRSMSLSTLLSAGDGKLATGPVRLLEVYKDVLSVHQTTVEIRFSHGPKRWDGTNWVAISSDQLRVLLLDETYVVANGFRATRSINNEG